jgi:hypothetical protein
MPILDRRDGRRSLELIPAGQDQNFRAPDAGSYGEDLYQPGVPERGGLLDGGARTCGAADCTSGWMKPWRNRKRPIFEEEWGCSNRCLKTMVRAAIRRETGQSNGVGVDVPHRHRVPLGLVLLAQGWITHPQLQAALEAQKQNGKGRIGDWLVQSCGLAEERVTRGLGVQWSCPVLALNGFSPSAMALVMPKRFISEFGLVPLRVAGSGLLYLAFENRTNAAAAFGIEQMTGLKVESGLLSGSQFASAKKAVLEADAVPMLMQTVADADEVCDRLTKVLEVKQPLASRLVRVHNYYWMRVWLESGAMSGVGHIPGDTNDVEDYLLSIKEAGQKD